MNLLAIDSSLNDLTVCASNPDGDKILLSIPHERNALSRLTPMMQEAFDRVGIHPADVHAVGCVVGPGSFTGVRVGVSTAKAFAFSVDAQMVALSSLYLLALAALESNPEFFGDELICPVVHCVPGEVYTAVYAQREEGRLVCLEKDQAMAFDQLAAVTKDLGHTSGRGVVMIGPALERPDFPLAEITHVRGFNTIPGSLLLRESLAAAKAGFLVHPLELQANYCRLSQPEVRLERGELHLGKPQ